MPSAEQSYTVSGSELTDDIVITPPDDFEISLTSGSGFVAAPNTLNLQPTAGTISPSTIYVRFNPASAGASSGNITHASTGAATRNVVVTGTATVPLTSWVAYNDLAHSGTQPDTNITLFTIPGESNPSSGTLVDYATGQETPVDVAITVNGNVSVQTSGSMSASGTDAYDTFNGITDMTGVVQYPFSGGTGWYVDLTFNGLDPNSTYTFATTANRDGGTSSNYADRYTRFTVSGVEAAVNASTPGVTVDSDYVSIFNTGHNTADGYVARWTGINPGADGSFMVRAQAHERNEAYGFSVFMLGHEGEAVTYTLEANDDGNGSVDLSPAGGSYVQGTTVTLTPVPDTGFAFSHWSGADAAGIVEDNGTYTIVMDEDKSVTANFVVSYCSDVSLVATADTMLRASTATSNYGATEELLLSHFSMSARNTLFRWDLSSIPDVATVSEASLTFYVTDGSNQQANLYNMRRAWIEGNSDQAVSNDSANWNTYDGVNAWGEGGAESATQDHYGINLWSVTNFTGLGSQTFDLNADGLDVVQGWIDGSVSNYGATIQRNSDQTSQDYWTVYSREVDDEAQRPTLNVTYCLPATDPTIVTSGAGIAVVMRGIRKMMINPTATIG